MCEMKTFKDWLFEKSDKIIYAKDGWLVSEDREGNIEKIEELKIDRVKLDRLEYKI